MKRLTASGRRLGIVLLIALLVSLFAPLALQAAAQGQPVAVVTAARLNIRSGPGSFYPSLGTVGRGEVVTLLGRNGDSSWAYVNTLGGLTGWATTYYLETTVAWSSLPIMTGQAGAVPAPQSPAPPASATGTASLVYPPVRVNTAAGDNHGIITYLEPGEKVELKGRNEDATWVYILFRGNGLGWSNASRINTDFNVAALPFVDDMEAPVGENLSPNILATAQTFYGQPAPTTGGQGGGAVFVPLPVTGPVGTVNTYRLNVRSGPGPGYAVIGQLVQGQIVTIVGRDSLGAWLQVVLPTGLRGWVSALYITEMTDVAAVPVEATYDAVGLVTTGALNVRSGPGPWYSRVTVVYQGELITLIGRIPDATWYKVLANGQEGWVDARFIRTNYPVQDLPVFRASAGDF